MFYNVPTMSPFSPGAPQSPLSPWKTNHKIIEPLTGLDSNLLLMLSVSHLIALISWSPLWKNESIPFSLHLILWETDGFVV